MLYAREISDSVVIQLIIMYTIQKAEKPLSRAQLDKLVLGNCIINFVDYSIALENLEDLKYIYDIENDGIYTITDEGEQAVNFFKDKIPGYVRESIKESIKVMFREDRKKNSVRARLIPYNEDEFLAECVITEGKKTLMHLEIYAGKRKEAEKLCRAFKEDPGLVYQFVMKAFDKIGENI